MVVDVSLSSELSKLDKQRISTDGLRVSHEAGLVTPIHVLLDRIRESSTEGRIGTTGRGIGPAYTDKTARIGLTVNDLMNPDVLASRVRAQIRRHTPELTCAATVAILEKVSSAYEGGIFLRIDGTIDEDAVIDYLRTKSARFQ
jgi:adenylosuccinate synthase